ncbi:hypothetical protein F2Q69_00056391 [Brassica cretica]|uniref:Uncharacterized protein n=1 Tax=Brassica cretica TaxID=69181 RepID=A0A8S9N845_BRACR|nr:hypothetical protein F2Q69_00056391 [Brassica cretica]
MYVANGWKLRRVANRSKQLSGRERAGYRTVSGRVEQAEIVSREQTEVARFSIRLGFVVGFRVYRRDEIRVFGFGL